MIKVYDTEIIVLCVPSHIEFLISDIPPSVGISDIEVLEVLEVVQLGSEQE